MKKRVLIDATTVVEKTDGLSHYIINLLKNFPDEAFDAFDFSILVNKGVERKELRELLQSGKFKIVEVNIAPIGPRRDLDFYRFYRKNKGTFDAFHSTSNNYPLCIRDGIATIHDISSYLYLKKPWWTFNMAPRYLNMVILNSLKSAGSIIAVSQATKDILIDTYKVDEKIKNKIEVVYEGWEHLINNDNAKSDEDLSNQYGRYLFYVGTTRPHKNMKRLLKAFNIAKDKLNGQINLVLSGSTANLDEEDTKLIEAINIKSTRVIITGYVSKLKLESLFRHSEAFIFPSLCEGFGIPVLESFYFQKPLLCSNTTSLPEIAGDAALLFNPESVDEIANTIIYFYEHPELAATLVSNGKERLKQFSWGKAAKETIAIYHRHFDKKSHLHPNKKLKILHLIYTNGIAGAEKYLMYLLPPLKEQHGIECHLIMVCAPGFEAPLEKYCIESNESGIPTTLFISSRRNIFTMAYKIGQYLKKNQIIYIHSHLLNSDVVATVIKVIYNKSVRIISTKHGYKESILKQIPNSSNIQELKKEAKKELYYYITKYVVRHAKYNYAVSKAISKLYFDLGLTENEMPFIHHGVTVKYAEKTNELNAYRFSDKQLIIVGRLEEYKGHQYLIKAMPEVLLKFRGCKLVIIGEGSEKKNLQRLCSELKIDNNVLFMGFNDDPYSYVNNSDVIILPSLFEPFGLVYIEAFALKTPIVAFDTPAGNEIMENNTTALLVTPREANALAEKIIFLLDNPGIASEMADRAYRNYLENFSTARMVKDTALFYKEVEKASKL